MKLNELIAEFGDYEIEALRYIAEKGAVMEHKNVSNDDNR